MEGRTLPARSASEMAPGFDGVLRRGCGCMLGRALCAGIARHPFDSASGCRCHEPPTQAATGAARRALGFTRGGAAARHDASGQAQRRIRASSGVRMTSLGVGVGIRTVPASRVVVHDSSRIWRGLRLGPRIATRPVPTVPSRPATDRRWRPRCARPPVRGLRPRRRRCRTSGRAASA